MRRKGVVFSKMFVLRSMGNELVPSPPNQKRLFYLKNETWAAMFVNKTDGLILA